MDTINLDFHFRHLRCLQDSSNGRSGPPYLWTIFFKVDGQGVRVKKNFKLTGKAKFSFSEGSHGNLGHRKPVEGETIEIPNAVGRWQTGLKPIAVPVFNRPFPALIGAISVLLSQGNVTAAGAEAGHQRLNQYVEEAINLSIQHFDPQKVDILNAENICQKVL